MITDKLLESICLEEKEREFANPIRLSNSGKCARAIAYQLHFPDKLLPLPSRSRMVFRLGDTIETELKALLKKYPPEFEIIIPEVQEEVSVNIGNHLMKGHIDGRIKVGDEWYVLECKSINGMGFKRVLKGYIGDSYEAQATSYMKALGFKKTLFVFYCKDTSHIAEVVFNYDEFLWKQIEQRFLRVLSSTPENLPEREYKPNDKGLLPWQCSYCSAVRLCHPEHKIEFDDKSKPQLIVAERETK